MKDGLSGRGPGQFTNSMAAPRKEILIISGRAAKKKPGLLRIIRYLSEYALLHTVLLLVRRLSARSVYRLGKFIGRIVFYFAWNKRDVAMTNLNIAFGNTKSHHRKTQIIRKSFMQLAVSALQCLWLWHKPKKRGL